MLHSMTGYGKATCEYDGKKIVVEIKSLNSKTLDLSTRITNFYREKDLEIRGLVASRLERGKVEISIYSEDVNTTSSSRINTALVRGYAEQIKAAAQEAGLAVPDNLMELVLRMPDVMKTDVPALDDCEWQIVLQTVNQAIDRLESFRLQEGASLQRMFTEKLHNISALLAEVEPYEGERIDKIKKHLEENLKTLEEKISIDRNRLEQEMIYYIEKLDVNEEKTRLRNHLKYFSETMEIEKAPGKKLGFIAQEMGREINTLGSKSNHSEMQIIVVKMKDELEQIKEQVLNVL
ncbi:MAG: YicC/YloC family endoribonuclease [Candidatus Aphodosoma sp.]